MYEWIRGNITSLFTAGPVAPQVGIPNRSSAVPVKRNYQSVQASNDEIEWISVKRQRLGNFVNTVKKSISGFVGYMRLLSPFGYKVMQVDSKSTVQRKQTQPLKQILSSSLTDLRYCSSGESLPRADFKFDVDRESRRRNYGNERNWHEFDKIKQRPFYELPGETSEQQPLPVKCHSLPPTPSPGRKNVRSHHCTVNESIEKNEKEQYQLLLRLVAAGLDKKSKQQPSVSASNPTQRVSSASPSQCHPIRFESKDRLGDYENKPITLPTLKLGSSLRKNPSIVKSTSANTNVRQIWYDDPSRVLQTTRGSPTATMKEHIVEQNIERDLSDEVAARLYLDEGDATTSVKTQSSQNLKENLNILSKEQRGDLPRLTERMVEAVRKALDCGEPDEVLSTGFKLRITRKDIGTLCNHSWLNDEVADLRKKIILHLDSMGQWNDDVCWTLLRYLQEESKNKKGRHLDSSEWVLRSMRSHEIPQQMNGSDCGVFVCKYADYIAKDEQINFTQHDIPYFRMKMVWEILHKRLL
ncbi:sentrin-specific protease 2-like isoform X3 [Mustelus asterias]